jgi:uncharacterized membrane protein
VGGDGLLGAVFALAASVLWGAADFGGGLLSRLRSAQRIVLLSHAVSLALLLVVVGVVRPHWGWYVLYGVAAGACSLVALVTFYRAMAAGPMTLVAPITATGMMMPVLYGVATGERLSLAQGVGMVLALFGVVLASGPQLRGDRAARTTIVLAVVATVSFGGVMTLLSLGGGHGHGLLPLLTAQRAVSVTVLGVTVYGARARSRRATAGSDTDTGAGTGADAEALPPLTARQWLANGLLGVSDTTANAAYVVSTQQGGLAVVSALSSLYPVVTALLARYVLAERLGAAQTAGVVTALGGVVMLNV